ncbi:MAG: hypothetical protein LBT59_29920 [Clostridiales bacterium]|jgi:hypothetical protein|nr:hypothetical protein [Clostridiales bacterium]
MVEVELEDLAGIEEVADFLKVTKLKALGFRDEYSDFPRPLRVLQDGALYDLREIKAWGIMHQLC